MKKILIILAILGIAAVGVVAGRRGYDSWATQRTVRAAREAFSRSDYKGGLLWLRKALARNPNQIEAIRMMADFTELIRSPEALQWWERLVHLEPNSSTNRISMARVALVAGNVSAARNALDGIGNNGRGTPAFHQLMGACAAAAGDIPQAESHFLEACRIDPANPVSALNLASIRIRRSEAEVVSNARQVLEGLRTNPAAGTDAVRNLLQDALRYTNFVRAVSLAGELVRDTNSGFSDRLLQLDVLRTARDPKFGPTLAGLQGDLATNAVSAFSLGVWMLKALPPGETLKWVESLPPQIRTNPPVSIVAADAFHAATNWTALDVWTAHQQWGELEYLRFALRTRALRERGHGVLAKAEWSKALKSVEGQRERLVAMERLATVWNWREEQEELLWRLVTRFPSEKDFARALFDLLYQGGKTRSLLTLMAQTCKADPMNLDAKNNLAVAALLLRADEHRPHDLAREVYEKQPENPGFASTYAYSLAVQKKHLEGLKVMERLSSEQLENPSVAGYYGLLLAASGDKVKARKYLDRVDKGRLLPEEVRLFHQARL